ncbi:MAG: hypothetical protein DRR19_16250 [Candidatus Parabeggiatoa sp. nov. 1]|nr:MAG: hypothetical protein DRR19_16250 [Gammaproteobacteria bacterium]
MPRKVLHQTAKLKPNLEESLGTKQQIKGRIPKNEKGNHKGLPISVRGLSFCAQKLKPRTQFLCAKTDTEITII